MSAIPYSKDVNDYLIDDEVVDLKNGNIMELADKLFQAANNEVE